MLIMQARGPNPARFQTYEETPDGKGFYLPTGEFFKFDQYGGWYAMV